MPSLRQALDVVGNPIETLRTHIMKSIPIYLYLLTLTVSIRAQSFEKYNNLQYTTPFIKVKSTTGDLITRFTFGLLKFRSDTACIEFDFAIRDVVKSFRPDSIILAIDNSDDIGGTGYGNEIVLNYPYRDTIIRTNNN